MMQDILGPNDPIPPSVQFPQVARVHTNRCADFAMIETRAGQRISVSFDVMHDGGTRMPADQLALAAIAAGGLR